MESLIGSKFETSLRVLVLLEAAQNKELSEGAITALDFITVYSHDFGFPESNLNGEGKYRFAEFSSRRIVIRKAIKELVLDDLVSVSRTSKGFKYHLSNTGRLFVASLESEYANIYYENAEQIMSVIGTSEKQLESMINARIIASVREG